MIETGQPGWTIRYAQLIESPQGEQMMEWDHFMSADDGMVDYLTERQQQAFARQEASYETVREGAYKLLNLLVAGIGGAAMLLFSATSLGAPEKLGLAVLVIGWFCCAVYLLITCIQAKERPTAFGAASKYFDDDETTGEKRTLHTLRRLHLFWLESNTNKLIKINQRRGRRLNRASTRTALVPVVALAVWGAVHLPCLGFIARIVHGID